MTIDSADDSKISNRTITTNRISNRTYDSKLNRITKLRRSLVKTARTYGYVYGRKKNTPVVYGPSLRPVRTGVFFFQFLTCFLSATAEANNLQSLIPLPMYLLYYLDMPIMVLYTAYFASCVTTIFVSIK